MFPLVWRRLIAYIQGICAGKTTVADYLVRHYGFSRLTLGSRHAPSKDSSTWNRDESCANDELVFTQVDVLVDFVTKQWAKNWVITNIRNDSVLDILMRRPFFLFVSVDAPLYLRWTRLKGR